MTGDLSTAVSADSATIPISVHMRDGRAMSFATIPRLKTSSAFALSIRKSGSSLFSNLVTAIARHNGRNVIDLPGTAFQNGYSYADWNHAHSLRNLVWRGNVYVGFRDPPTSLFADHIFRHGFKILFVRDPRDVLVSEYFSNAYSHTLPRVSPEKSEIAAERKRALTNSIDDYVLSRVAALNATAEGYQPLLGDRTIRVLRYEDFILRKAELCEEIAAHFEMSAPPSLVASILSWADVRPEVESSTSFIRKVIPGDHLSKLSPETIQKINAQLSPVWKEFGYPT